MGAPTPESLPSSEEKPQDLFQSDRPAFVLSGEWIFWTVAGGGRNYATRMTHPLPDSDQTLAQGDVAHASFDWDSGYRFSFGYFRAPHYWEAKIDYTFLHVNGSDQTSRAASAGLFLNPTFPYFSSEPIERALSSTRLHYQLANIIAYRVFLLPNNPHFRLKLGAAITATWLRQSWNIRYCAADETTEIKNRWRYWGIGPRVAVHFDWFWGYDIYITGKYSTALVGGHYRNRFREETTVPKGDGLLKEGRLSLNVSFSLGPSYQKSFSWGRIELFAGYELTLWSNLQDTYQSLPSAPAAAKQLWSNRGLLTLHGLTTRLTLNF